MSHSSSYISIKSISIIMKKGVFYFLFALALFYGKTEAQVCNPYYAGYCGYVACMPIGNGYYMGPVMYGCATGNNGYVYYYDINWGYSVYHGGFYAGVPHGQGEMMCSQGYIAGVWNYGVFVQQYAVNTQNIQSSVSSIQKSNPNPKSIDISNVRITEIDSDSELGRQMLGGLSR